MTYHDMAQAARTMTARQRVQMAYALLRIYEADRTRNCGVVNGEADLCRAFSAEAKHILTETGVIPG